MIKVENLSKTFTLHTQGGISYPVLDHVSFDVKQGECLVLQGPSGAGKSTLLRTLYGNYKTSGGSIWILHEDKWLDITKIDPRMLLELRRYSIGYVSQFLRIIPRVTAVDIVSEPLRLFGIDQKEAHAQGTAMLKRLHIPARLFSVSPATFSGGEQQRINIARCFLPHYPVLLLDEPTASLDQKNREVFFELITEAKARGAAIVGIFHNVA